MKVFRGTDIVAGVFALVGTLQAAYLPLLLLLGTLARRGRPEVGPPPSEPNRGWLFFLYPAAVLLLVSAVLLFVGAFVLFIGGKNGRRLTFAGATTSIVVQLMPATFNLGRDARAVLPQMIILMVPAMVAAVLVLVPRTSNWIAANLPVSPAPVSEALRTKMPGTAHAAIVCAIFAAAKSFLLPIGMGLGLLLSGGRDGIVPGTSGAVGAEWTAVAYAVCNGLLVAGVARLTGGTRGGQVLLITACLLTVVVTLVEGSATLVVEGDTAPLLIGSIFGVVPAMLAATLAAAPPTSDWIAARSG